MKCINIFVIDGKEIEYDALPDTEKKRLSEELNKRALGAVGFFEKKEEKKTA